jgi:hypothetical protein
VAALAGDPVKAGRSEPHAILHVFGRAVVGAAAVFLIPMPFH